MKECKKKDISKSLEVNLKNVKKTDFCTEIQRT